MYIFSAQPASPVSHHPVCLTVSKGQTCMIQLGDEMDRQTVASIWPEISRPDDRAVT